MDDFEMIDVSDNVKKKDKFMLFVIISIILLIILFLTIYFFGYDFLKPYIKV